MIKRVAELSTRQGFSRSRLPKFTAEEVEYLKGTADFFGLNHYTARIAKASKEPLVGEASWRNDIGVIQSIDESWPKSGSDWIRVPIGITLTGSMLLCFVYCRKHLLVFEKC